MPKPVLTEVLADLLPFQQAVSNELGKLAVQIYTGGAAVRCSPSAQPLLAGVAVPRTAERLLALPKRDIFKNFLYATTQKGPPPNFFSVSAEKRKVKEELRRFRPSPGSG